MRVELRAASDLPPAADVVALPVGPGGLPAGGEWVNGAAARVAEEEGLAATLGSTAVLYPDGDTPARRIV
jgi:hypothetical protein